MTTNQDDRYGHHICQRKRKVFEICLINPGTNASYRSAVAAYFDGIYAVERI